MVLASAFSLLFWLVRSRCGFGLYVRVAVLTSTFSLVAVFGLYVLVVVCTSVFVLVVVLA